MSIYSLGFVTTDVTINHASFEVYTAATLSAKIWEIGFGQVAATSCTVGLGVPQAQGVTPVAAAVQAEQNRGDPSSKTNISLSWATSPTVPLAYFRRYITIAQIGAGFCWTFPMGLHMPPSTSLVLFNITAIGTGGLNCWIVLDD